MVALSAAPAAAEPICGGLSVGLGLMNPSGNELTMAVEVFGGYMPVPSLCVLVDAAQADGSYGTDEGTLYSRQRMIGGGVRYWFIRRAWVHPVLGVGRAIHDRDPDVTDTALSYSLSVGADFYRDPRFACEVSVRYSDGLYDDPDPFWAATLNVGCGLR